MTPLIFPSAPLNIKTIIHRISLCLLFMMLLSQVLQAPSFRWRGSSIVSSHLVAVDHAALDMRQRRRGGSVIKYRWCKKEEKKKKGAAGGGMVEVVDGEFLLWFCCLSCLQMLFELWADVKTSQVPRCIRCVTSKLGLINEKELNTHPDDTKRGRRLVVCTGKFFCFFLKKAPKRSENERKIKICRDKNTLRCGFSFNK